MSCIDSCDETLFHCILVGVVVGLADIYLTAGLTGLHLNVYRCTFCITYAAGNISA